MGLRQEVSRVLCLVGYRTRTVIGKNEIECSTSCYEVRRGNLRFRSSQYARLTPGVPGRVSCHSSSYVFARVANVGSFPET
jgi:hypothetical protein